MKKIFLIFLIASLAVSCGKPKQTVVNEKTILTGNIAYPASLSLQIYRDNPYDIQLINNIPIDTTSIMESGHFKLTLNLKKGEKFFLLNGDEYLAWDVFLVPGDSLNIDVLNYGQVYQYKYSGRGKSVSANRAYQNFLKTFPLDDNHFKQTDTSNYFAYLSYIQGRKESQLKYLKQHFNDDSIPEIARNYTLSYINYEWAFSRANYLLDKYYNTANKTFAIDSTFFDFAKDVSINEPEPMLTVSYIGFVQRYIQLLVARKISEQMAAGASAPAGFPYQTYYNIAKNQLKGTARDIAVTFALKEEINWNANPMIMDSVKQLLMDFKSYASDNGYISLLTNLFNSRLKLMPWQPAPDFTLPNSDGHFTSLADNRGKIIFMDFWGTWCQPCIQEMPYYRELQKKFEKDKDIVFISLALEYNNRQVWEKYVKDQKLPGIQCYVEGQFKNPVSKVYMITGVPQFVIIDKQGKIVTPNAPAPSDPRLEGILNRLLGKTGV